MKQSLFVLSGCLIGLFVLISCENKKDREDVVYNRLPTDSAIQESPDAARDLNRLDNRDGAALDTSRQRPQDADELAKLPKKVAEQVMNDQELSQLRLVNSRRYILNGETRYEMIFDQNGNSKRVVMNEDGRKIDG